MQAKQNFSHSSLLGKRPTGVSNTSQLNTQARYLHTFTLDGYTYSILWHQLAVYAVINPEGDLVLNPDWHPFFTEQEALAWCEQDALKRQEVRYG